MPGLEQEGRPGSGGQALRLCGECRHGVAAPGVPAASPPCAGSPGVSSALYRVSSSRIARAASAAQAASPGPCAMATVADQPGAEPRPAVVALDLDPHRHALDHAGELSGDDVPRHQGELGPGRLVDPDDPPWNGSAKASSSMRTGLPGSTPGRRSSSRLAST